jgi:hypothetical protein
VAGVQTFRVGRLSDDLKTERARLETQTQQAEVNQAGAQINDRRSTNTRTAYQHSEEAQRAVAEAPDYDAALREFGLGIDRVREAGRASVTGKPDGRGSDAG